MAQFAVTCMNNISRVGTDRLSDTYDLFDEATCEPECISTSDAWIVRSANLHERELPQSLLAIARAGAGTNNIPIDRCSEQGILVFNTPGANANAVKELVICGMLLSCRDIVGGIEWVREHASDPDVATLSEKAKKQFGGNELAGRRVGVIGLGAIGAAVANALVGLGCEVMGFDPHLSISAAWRLDRRIIQCQNLSDLCSSCDFITIHVPGGDATRHLLNAELIGQMQPQCTLLNFARQSVVDEEAVAAALNAGSLGHYVSDFPNPTTAGHAKTLVLPHLGASTGEAEDNCAVMAVCQLRDYLENGNVTNAVNMGRVDLGPLVSGSRLALFHENVQGVIGQVSQLVATHGLNIENMSNVSRGPHAYTLLELSGEPCGGVVGELAALPHIRRARALLPVQD